MTKFIEQRSENKRRSSNGDNVSAFHYTVFTCWDNRSDFIDKYLFALYKSDSRTTKCETVGLQGTFFINISNDEETQLCLYGNLLQISNLMGKKNTVVKLITLEH